MCEKQPPFFSIIVPVYKVEDYLPQCIQSVLDQTFPDFELVLVDDGSPDACGRICDSYAKEDSRIQVLHQQNQGQSAARNNGLELACGTYVLFLDSDDFYPQKDLLAQIAAASSGKDIVCFNYARFTDRLLAPLTTFPSGEGLSGEALLLEMVRLNAFTSAAWSKAVRRSLLLENSITFETKMVCGEDIGWNAQVLLAAKTVAMLPDGLYAYRVRQNSITHNISPRHVQDLVKTIHSLAQAEIPEDDPIHRPYFSYVAFQYCTLLINICLCRPKLSQEKKDEVRKMAWLLQYDTNRIVWLIHKVYGILGFTLTSRLLLIYFKLFCK